MDAQCPEWLPELQHPWPGSLPQATQVPLLFDAEHLPITTAPAWQARRQTLLQHWAAFLGSIEGPRASNKVEVLEVDPRENVIRQLVRYESGTGLPVKATCSGRWDRRDRPGVVVLHSTVDCIRQPAGLRDRPQACRPHLPGEAMRSSPRCSLAIRRAEAAGHSRRLASSPPSRRHRDGQDALQRAPCGRYPRGSAGRKPRPTRRFRPFPGGQGGTLPGGLRPPNHCRGLERGRDGLSYSNWDAPGTWARRFAVQASVSTMAGACSPDPGLPADRWRLADSAVSWPHRRRTPRLVPQRCPRGGRPAR